MPPCLNSHFAEPTYRFSGIILGLSVDVLQFEKLEFFFAVSPWSLGVLVIQVIPRRLTFGGKGTFALMLATTGQKLAEQIQEEQASLLGASKGSCRRVSGIRLPFQSEKLASIDHYSSSGDGNLSEKGL